MARPSTNIMTDFSEIFNEFCARCAVADGEPVDEVCAQYKRNWSAHERLTFHQDAQEQMHSPLELFWQNSRKVNGV